MYWIHETPTKKGLSWWNADSKAPKWTSWYEEREEGYEVVELISFNFHMDYIFLY